MAGTWLDNVTTSRTYTPDFGDLETMDAVCTSGCTTPRTLYSFVVESVNGRNKDGQLLSVTETVEGVSRDLDYTYDALGRLGEVRIDGVLQATYVYDATGNRLSVTRGAIVTSGTYDDQDRLNTWGAATYDYDALGQLETRTQGTDVTTYDYDVQGHLRSVTLPNATTIEYVIDALGRRVGRKVGSTFTHKWLYGDALSPIAELNPDNTVRSVFVYGTRPNVPDYMDQSGIRYRIVSDRLGSARLVVNTETGVVAQRIDYDEYGRVLTDTAPGFQPFGFAGGMYDTATGLVRFGARDYDPETGRWLGKDPLLFDAGDVNLYRYAYNDPVNLRDPTGLYVETLADIGFIGYDLYRLWADNIAGDCDNLWENLSALGLDGLGLALPFATALGSAARAGNHAGDAAHVFWSGGDSARDAAARYASDMSGTTLEMTQAGRSLEATNLPWSEARPLWENASREFAESASGQVDVFMARTPSPDSIWRTVERPALEANSSVTGIRVHLAVVP